MASIVPENWRDKACRAGEQDTSGQSVAQVLPAHDSRTISSSKAQHKLGKLVIGVRHERYVASLDQLLETTPQRATGDSQGEKETRGSAKARERSQSGPGATAFFGARPVDSATIIPASVFVTMGRRLLGIERFLPLCDAAEANTRDARLRRHRSGVLEKRHQPQVHTLSRTFKSRSIRLQVESGALFHVNRDFRVKIVIEMGGLRDATASEYRNKAIVLDVTYAGPQTVVHMRTGSADRGGSAAFTSEARKQNHYARPGQVSIDEGSLQTLHALAVESVGRLGKEGSDLID